MNRQATVRRRLREVIDALFDGNVKAAAAAAGVAQPTLHKIVSGDVAESKGSTIERLADAYGIPVGWLRGEVELLPGETVGGRGPRWLNLIRLYTMRTQHNQVGFFAGDEIENHSGSGPKQHIGFYLDLARGVFCGDFIKLFFSFLLEFV